MILDIQTAPPPFVVTAETGATELKKRMGASDAATPRMIDMIARYAGIKKRHIVLDDAEERPENPFYSINGAYYSPGTSERMRLYEKWSVELGTKAAQDILTHNNVAPEDVERLITISCTGFFAPGQDYAIIKNLGLSPEIKRTNIGFMGCAASLIGFNSVYNFLPNLSAPHKKILMISLELCSLHMQTEPTKDNILSNLLFADGCAAVLFGQKSSDTLNFAVEETYSFLFENSAEFMGWKVGNHGFEMMLSQELPSLIAQQAVPALKNWLDKKGYVPSAIRYWALHPGGKAIIKAVEDGMQLRPEQTKSSYTTLAEYGNMSSASILYVLKDILENNTLQKDEVCCAVAFGPGLTMEAAILRVV